MDTKKLLEKCRSRLVLEGLLKALLVGVIVGFAVDFVFALITAFFTEYFDYWYLVALGVGLGTGLIAGIVIYFLAFRPDTKKIARRIDALGLEERLITMTELENDDSYIARRQREDAKEKLSKFDVKSIKFVLAKSLIIAAIIVGVFGLSMTTVNALVQYELIPEGDSNIFNPLEPDDAPIMVLYEVTDDTAGWIEGEVEQLVEVGGRTSVVTAVAAEGYMFMYWEEDQKATAERFETNIIDDDEDGIIIFTAYFEEIPDNDEEGDLPTDEPSDVPQEEQNDTFDPDNKPNKEGQGDRYASSNQVMDGKTPYQSVFDEYYEKALEDIQNGNYTEEEAAIIKAYFDILKGGVGADKEGE